MSVLCDRDIERALQQGRIGIKPFRPTALNPASYDIRVDRWFRVMVNHSIDVIDPKLEQADLTELVEVDEYFVLHPTQFALATTIEEINLTDTIVSRIEGKSSLARLGLQVHSTAGWLDPGFCGQVTLELSNAAPLPIRVYPGMPVGQLSFMVMSGHAENPYGTRKGSKYQGQIGPMASQYWRNFDEDDDELG